MDLTNLNQHELQERCSWCHKVIGEDDERFGGGAKVRPEAKQALAELAGKLMPMRLGSGREFIAIIPAANTPARAAGHDLYFQTCSEQCSTELTKAMREELAKNA
jgi:hypothetical protein